MKKFLVFVTVLLFGNICILAQNDTTLYSELYYFVLNGKVQTSRTIDTFFLTFSDSNGNQIKISGNYEIGKIKFKSKDYEIIKHIKNQNCTLEFYYKNPNFFKKSKKYEIENIKFFSNVYLEIIDTPEIPPGYGFLMTNFAYFNLFNLKNKYHNYIIYD